MVVNLKGWGDGDEASKIMIMAGAEDKLVGVLLKEDMAGGLQTGSPNTGGEEEARCG